MKNSKSKCSNLPGSPRRTCYFLRVYLCVLASHLPPGLFSLQDFQGYNSSSWGITWLWKVSQPVAGRWNEMSLKLPSKPNPSGMILPLPHCHCISTSSITSLTIICSDKGTPQLKSLPRTESVVWLHLICVIYQKGRAMNAHKNHYTK